MTDPTPPTQSIVTGAHALVADARRESALVTFISAFARNRGGMYGLAIVVLMVLAAILAPQISGHLPTTIAPADSQLSPSMEHLMGTDQLGRDVFSQVLHGARVSIYIGIAASLIETIIGTVLGALAGYLRGAVDVVLMRLSEVVMTFPPLVLVLIFVALLGPGVNNVILVFALTGWMTTFRLVRGEFMSVREETYVESARSMGFSKGRIIFHHMLPNTMSPIVVAFTINTAIYIIAEAGLSYLGLGVPVTTPTWGNLLSAAQSPDVMKQYWWLWVFPALSITVFVVGVNFFGDGLRDVLDPRAKRVGMRRKLRPKWLGSRREESM